jgi:aryl-alcohol dehydrogenase-like predicted oxidoreductase
MRTNLKLLAYFTQERHDSEEDTMGQALLGTMTFGDTVDLDTARAMVGTALELGIDHIDTANVYTAGEAERMLGKLLAGRRDEVTLATKVGMPHEDAGTDPPLSAVAISRCVHESLKRLDTDRVDVLYLHQPDRSTPLDETLSAVRELQQEGKVLEFGLSNYSAWMTRDVAHRAAASDMPGPAIGQQLLNLLARRLEEEYLEMATSSGVRTAVYNPLSGGLLTGRHDFEHRPSTGRFGDSRLAATYQDRYWSPAIFDAIAAYQKIADDAGMSLIELSLRWVTGHPGVDAVLLGASKVEHISTNVELMARGALPADVIEACNAVGATLRGAMPAYHR